jgi:hypothetical protein
MSIFADPNKPHPAFGSKRKCALCGLYDYAFIHEVYFKIARVRQLANYSHDDPQMQEGRRRTLKEVMDILE